MAVTVIVAMLTVLLVPSGSQQAADSRLYELMSRFRPPVEEDRALVIIEMPPAASSAASETVLRGELFLTLEEMGAKEALLTVSGAPPDSASPLGGDQGAQIRNRFKTEFDLVKKNVAVLFDAIRFGSVQPQDAAKFVDELLVLIDRGGERLLDDILYSDARSAVMLEKAKQLFGEDNLGKVPADLDYVFPEYDERIVVPEFPRPGADRLPFRRLPLTLVYAYAELEQELALLLKGMEEVGFFSGIKPELQPTILYDQVQTLLAELLDTPQNATKSAWLDARENFVQSVDALLGGDSETVLDSGFVDLLVEEQDDEAKVRSIEALRQHLAGSFSKTGEIFAEFVAFRNLLSLALDGSICVIGTAPDPVREFEEVWSSPTAAETATAEMNSIRADRFSLIVTGLSEKISFAVPGLVFAVLLGLLSLRLVLPVGFLAMGATAVGCLLLYLKTGIFVHPLYAAVVSGAAMAATLAAALLVRIAYTWQIMPGAGHRFPGFCRRTNIALRKAQPAALVHRRSVILAICSPGLKDFHRIAAGEIESHGGVIVGAEGPVLLAGFGTPFDYTAGRKPDRGDDVKNALRAALRLSRLRSEAPVDWSFGLDVGECHFYVSAVNGYSVEGSAAVYAQYLSRIAPQYGYRTLITGEILDEAGDGWTVTELRSPEERKLYALIGPRQA